MARSPRVSLDPPGVPRADRDGRDEDRRSGDSIRSVLMSDLVHVILHMPRTVGGPTEGMKNPRREAGGGGREKGS